MKAIVALMTLQAVAVTVLGLFLSVRHGRAAVPLCFALLALWTFVVVSWCSLRRDIARDRYEREEVLEPQPNLSPSKHWWTTPQ